MLWAFWVVILCHIISDMSQLPACRSDLYELSLIKYTVQSLHSQIAAEQDSTDGICAND